MDTVIELARMILKRWHIDPRNIIGHFDIHPAGKQDPSGYFNWTMLYNELGYFTDIWPTNLSNADQKVVLINATNYDPTKLLEVQTGLRK